MPSLLNVWKSVRLRCPHCGKTPLIHGFLNFHEVCGACGYRYLGDSGDFWGQVVISYTFAGIFGISTGAILFASEWSTWDTRIYVASIVALGSTVVTFPFAKSLWIHFLYLTRGQYDDYAPPDRKGKSA